MEVNEKLRDVIVNELGVDKEEVKLDASFMDDLGADSLDTVELIMAVEEEFAVEINDEEAEKIKTVKDAQELIEKKIKENCQEGDPDFGKKKKK